MSGIGQRPSGGGEASSLFPLVTSRLCIDPLTIADIETFSAYRRDPAVARFQSWEPTFDIADARRLIAAQPVGELPEVGAWLQLAVRARADGSLLGDVALHTLGEPNSYEIGVTIAPASQGTGVATEALRSLLGTLFTALEAHRVVAFCDTRNAPVARLLGRLGMHQESRQREAEWLKGEWTTVDGYALLEGEYRPSTAVAH